MSSEPPHPHPAILVTGASGFVGAALVQRLKADGRCVYPALRKKISSPDARLAPDLSATANWRPALQGVDVIVHTAARVHVMNDNAADPLAEFRAANVDGTLTLARQAAEVGVRRFVFISSIKVNGEVTAPGVAFSPANAPAPVDDYGISKTEAEAGLHQIARDTGMQVVIIRPPLVYGPGVRANFQSMMRWLQRGIPLPFGSIQNKRSLVALDNLVDLITVCIDHPAAANRLFLAADGEDMSTPELLRRTAVALHTEARLFPMPVGLLIGGARLMGKPALAQRLCGSLQVDVSAARDVLGWRPPLTVEEGLRQTAQWFMKNR
jgi:nucleoside-diphosphate-sugar epimerase